MPCADESKYRYRDEYVDRCLRKKDEEHKLKLDELTSFLCSACKKLSKDSLINIGNSVNKNNLLYWYSAHLDSDIESFISTQEEKQIAKSELDRVKGLENKIIGLEADLKYFSSKYYQMATDKDN